MGLRDCGLIEMEVLTLASGPKEYAYNRTSTIRVKKIIKKTFLFTTL